MRIGLIGAGIMGAPMAMRLLGAGHEVAVYNRTPAKLEPLTAMGAFAARSPAEAASGSDVVISIVTNPDAVEQVTFGEDGIASGLSSDAVHCDMSTVTPTSADAVRARHAASGRRFVQAPVLGSKKQIAAGTLIVLAGGASGDIDLAEKAWSAFSGETHRFETPGRAATVKLAYNMLIGQMILGLGQSLLFAERGGVDPQAVLDIIQSSNLASPMYGSKGATLLEGAFAPNFVVRNMLKDLNLAQEAASAMAIPQPMNAAARELFVSAVGRGYGDEDYSAVVKALKDMAG